MDPKERRRASRIDFDGDASLLYLEQTHRVTLLDLSVRGARVRTPLADALPDNAELTLQLSLGDADLTLILRTEIRHRHAQELGLMFVRPSSEVLTHLRRLTALYEGATGDDDPTRLLPPDTTL